jgi:hypothetical protein
MTRADWSRERAEMADMFYATLAEIRSALGEIRT